MNIFEKTNLVHLMNQSNYKASFYTLGCRLNQAETAIISNTFKSKGYDVVDFEKPTDVCVINTCTVTEKADAECRKLVRQVLRRSPDAFVAVVGCYAQIGTEALQQIDGIDLIVGTEEKMRVSEFIDVPHKLPTPLVRKKKISRTPFTIGSVGNYEHATRANLKIQDGCDFMCSFCVIPFARGRARSRAFWDIQREAIELVEVGHKEIVLTGVNIGTYDFEGKTLLDVIKMLERIDGLERIRISSIEPTTIPIELVDHIAESAKLCRHLHIPIQSGDDTVLRNMRRLYSVAEFTDFLEMVQTRVPEICFGTDVMVGFPGEGEGEFQNTANLLRELPLAYFHVFSFSERGGTAAARMSDKVDFQGKCERSRVLRSLSKKKRQEFYRGQVGKTVRVLMEDRDEAGLFQGLTDNYIKVGIADDRDLGNQFVNVQIETLLAREMLLGTVE